MYLETEPNPHEWDEEIIGKGENLLIDAVIVLWEGGMQGSDIYDTVKMTLEGIS